MNKSIVIIPSVRNPEVINAYLKNAEKYDFPKDKLFFLIITEDFADKSAYKNRLKDYGVDGEVYGESERNIFLKENNIEKYKDLIPKKSHAETTFGLIYMAKNKEFRYGFFIDDDTVPENSFDYFDRHIKNLEFEGEIEEASSDKNWVNVLYQNFKNHKLYPRGYPYSKTNETIKTNKAFIKKGQIFISQGLWTNIPDLDAVRILMDGDLNGQSKTRLRIDDFKSNFITARDNFQTVCSMNLAFRRAIIPAFYQFPMDDNPFGIGRFDDIWSGLVVKRVLDKLDGYVMNGAPLCIHNKAPRSTFKDLKAEVPGYESNEVFSDIIKDIQYDENRFDENKFLQLTELIAQKLINNGRTEFIKYCGQYLNKYVDLMKEIYIG